MKTGLGGISMLLEKEVKRLQRPWPFQTPALSLQSTPPKGTGACADMQPWPKPRSFPQHWCNNKVLRQRKNSTRLTFCER